MDNAKKEKSVARYHYHRRRFMYMSVGIALFFVGLICLAVERVRLEVSGSDTLSWLALGFNLCLTIGGALIGASALHYFMKRNAEVQKIRTINGEVRHIEEQIINLLKEGEVRHEVQASIPHKQVDPMSGNNHPDVAIADSGGSSDGGG